MTSILVKNFTSPLPYASTEDERFIENRRVLNWIEDWEIEVSGRVDLNASDRNKLIFSDKLLFDLKSMIIGFEQICRISFQLNPGCIIKSMFVNIHTGQPHVFFLDSSVSLMKCCKNIQKLSTLSGALICGVCTIDYSTN